MDESLQGAYARTCKFFVAVLNILFKDLKIWRQMHKDGSSIFLCWSLITLQYNALQLRGILHLSLRANNEHTHST